MFPVGNWLLVFFRASGLFAIFPIFSAGNFPVQLRVALGGMTAFFIAPALPEFSLEGWSMLEVAGLMAMETLVGLFFGFISRLVFYGVQFAGSVIAFQMGLHMASQFNPFSADSQQLPAQILFYLAAVMFLSLDLHHWLLVAFQRSYELLPIGGAGLDDRLFVEVVSRVGYVFVLGLQMAAPAIAVAFLVTFVFALFGRVVPQMNVFTESFSFRLLAGLIVFGFTLQLMAQHIANYLRNLPEDVLRLARLLNVG